MIRVDTTNFRSKIDMEVEVFWRMSHVIYCPIEQPKTKATMTAADTNDTAAALAEPFAEFVSFRWQQPSFPPTQNANSAACSLTAACHFSGNFVINDVSVVTTTTFTTF